MSNYHPVSMQPQVLDLSKNTDLGTGEWGLKNFLEEKSIYYSAGNLACLNQSNQ